MEKVFRKDIANAIKGGADDIELDIVIQSHLDSFDQQQTVQEWRLENYAELRRWAYPGMAMFVDAQVKKKKGDKTEGDRQEEDYLQKCWDVKQRFPKV